MSQELFIAVRCEELPARFVQLAANQLAKGVEGLLKGVAHGAVRTWAAPRRVAVAIADVAEGRPAEEKLVTGPPAAAAFRDGQPTKAALGFARGKGVDVGALEVVDGPRGPVVAARIQTGGERTADLVAAGLDGVIRGMRFPMSMRWGRGALRWARPIHGVIALYAGDVIDAQAGGMQTGRSTIGHRLDPAPFEVRDAATWVAGLRTHHVEPDRANRRDTIRAQLQAAADAAGAKLQVDEDLLTEVADLVEWPVTVTCSFDEELLHLPPRLLVESMRVHQRVFPLWRGDDQLDHHFLAVTNNPFATDADAAHTIATGNAKVIGARFHDARFFYADDRKKTLQDHGDDLAAMRWIRGGGTMADKQRRVGALAAALAPRFSADADQAGRAGALCKADLATQMVGEFPELQGHVGRLLAGFDGEPGDVPLAIEEHYLPRFSGDALPTTAAGRVAALADRLDTLAGCFACGIRVKGSNDPLALRRAAIGLLQLLLMGGERTELAPLLAEALERAPRAEGAALDAVADDLGDFVMARFKALLKESFDTEVVEAVLAGGGDRDPVALRARVDALAALAATPAFGPVKATFKRALGLVKDHADPSYDAGAFEADAERALHRALLDLGPQAEAAEDALDFGTALRLLSQLKAPVDRLFDEVMVMAEDPAVRANRLGLLRAVCEAFRRVADLTLLSAE